MTVYLYARCSAEENFNKGSSIETQITKCNAYGTTKDLVIERVITEQVSGTIKFEKRNEGLKLLKKLKKGDHIICSALDRFSRNTLDLLTLVEKFKRNKVQLHFIDVGGEVTGSDAVGSVFLKLLSVFSEFYAKQMSEKQIATKERLKSQGKYLGGKKMFGYDVDDSNNLVPCEKEQEIIRQMQIMKQEGMSYQKVADEITKCTRKKFPVSWVFKIFKREGLNLKAA
ncbi:recombinase family protein [Alphaproteobacteria bacterium]|nr:recombinase family protein [Alphaproteobacteria bacterium]